MWISEIKLKNFRPFSNPEKPIVVTFKKEAKNKFSVIEAKSDVGKTTFLSAIAWCLYGEETSSGHDHTLPAFTVARQHDMKEKEIDSVYVEITLNDDETDLPIYVIKRDAMYQKLNNKMHILKEPTGSIMEWEKNDCRPVPEYNFTNVINSILPREIHLFFMFEGEKLEKHFSFNNNENIRQAIERTSQIKQVKLAIEHLQKVRDQIWTSDKDDEYDAGMAKLNHEIEEAEEYIARNTEAIETRKGEIAKAKEEIDRIEKFLSDYNIPLIREWARQERDIREKIASNNQEIDQIKKQLRTIAISSAPLAIASGALQNFINLINAELERDKFQPNIDNKYLEELLRQKKCVCGRTLNTTHDQECVTLLKEKIRENNFNEFKATLSEGKFRITDILEREIPQSLNEIATLNKKLEKLVELNKKHDKDLQEISKNLKDTKEDDIIQQTNQRESLMTNRESQIASVSRLTAAINLRTGQLSQLRQSLNQEGVKKKGGERKKVTAEFIDRASNALNKIEVEILQEVREQVQEKTWEYFKTLHWDKEKYTEFTINHDYDLRLTDGKGTNWMHNLASGPKQLLLLSFIAALSEVSGFKFPVFIDTPLANIDNEQRENVARKLPDYLKGTQVVLLMKDQEYTATIRDLLSKRIAQESRFVMSHGVTEVRSWN